MFDDMYFVNTANQTMHWNEDPNANGFFAVEEVIFERDIRTSDRNRMQAMGVWPNYTYYGKMVIHINGHLLANDATLLNNYKLQLMSVVMPQRTGLQFVDRKVGTFYLKYTGQSEYFYTDCGMESPPDIINAALSPANVACQLSLKSFFPYMLGVQSGRVYWVA